MSFPALSGWLLPRHVRAGRRLRSRVDVYDEGSIGARSERSRWIACVAIGLLLISACGDHVCNVLCPAPGGLDIGVVNDQSGEPICDATVIATEGAYVEQLTPQGCRYVGASGRPGTYSVRVERVAFRPIVMPNVAVRVRRTDCCEITDFARIEIRLIPEP